MNRLPPHEVLDCAGRAENGTTVTTYRFAVERRRRFRRAGDAGDRVSVREKSGVGKWNNIFDGSLCEQSDLQIGTTGSDGSRCEQPQSKMRATSRRLPRGNECSGPMKSLGSS